MKRVLILGGKGNGTIIAGALIDASRRGFGEFEFAGYLNDRIPQGEMIEGFPVLDSVQNAPKYIRSFYFINAILRIDGNRERISMWENLAIPEDRLASFVHPMSYVAPNVKLGPGTVVMPNSSISSCTTIGKGSLIMVGATIGHDNEVGSYCHVAAQACVGSYLRIGKGVHIGLNSCLREHLVVGDNATIGMGAVLTKSIGENEIWVGNPAKFLRYAN